VVKVVFVIAEKNFRDEELLEPKEILRNKGIECVIASKNKGTHIGMLGAIVESTLSLKEVDNSFDALVFIGGSGATQYFDDPMAQGLAAKYKDMHKIVAAICIAPSILANAGVLNGKKATCFSSESQNLKSKGAIFTKKPIEVDENIITAAGPIVAKKFGEYIAHSLGKY
jgi:protease I